MMTILTPEKRSALVEWLVERYLDGMTTRDLERFFVDTQLNYIGSYTDEELIGEIEDMSTQEEYAQLFEE
jgi:hypothetical protein